MLAWRVEGDGIEMRERHRPGPQLPTGAVGTDSKQRGRIATGRQSGAWESRAAAPDVAPMLTAPSAASNYAAGGRDEVMVSASNFARKEPLSPSARLPAQPPPGPVKLG